MSTPKFIVKFPKSKLYLGNYGLVRMKQAAARFATEQEAQQEYDFMREQNANLPCMNVRPTPTLK